MSAGISDAGIYFNALALTPGGSGVQTYARNVIAGVAERASSPLAARVQECVASELPPNVLADEVKDCSGTRRVLEGLRPLNTSARLIHGLDVDLPITRSAARVATVHDLAVFDVPWAFSPIRAAGERILLRANLRRADAIIAVSQFTADRLGERLGLEATVTHLAPRPDVGPATSDQIAEARARYKLPDRFILHVGTVEPRKGIEDLITACARIEVPLVLAGSVQMDLAQVGGVIGLGYVPARDLAPLYGGATAVAYPSVYEGFGLPPIEALACGAVVATTEVGALPEILGVAGYPLVPPGDLERLTELLSAVASDDQQRDEMRRLGSSIVGQLSWAKNAEKVIAVYAGLGVKA